MKTLVQFLLGTMRLFGTILIAPAALFLCMEKYKY